MNVKISKGAVRGEVVAPPSKSYTIRGLFCAALAEGESLISDPLDSDDTSAAAFGFGVSFSGQIGQPEA